MDKSEIHQGQIWTINNDEYEILKVVKSTCVLWSIKNKKIINANYDLNNFSGDEHNYVRMSEDAVVESRECPECGQQKIFSSDFMCKDCRAVQPTVMRVISAIDDLPRILNLSIIKGKMITFLDENNVKVMSIEREDLSQLTVDQLIEFLS